MNGHRLKERREELGLTQAGVATKAGIAQLHYAAMEQGRVGDLKATTARSIARALSTTTDELLDDLFGEPAEPEPAASGGRRRSA